MGTCVIKGSLRQQKAGMDVWWPEKDVKSTPGSPPTENTFVKLWDFFVCLHVKAVAQMWCQSNTGWEREEGWLWMKCVGSAMRHLTWAEAWEASGSLRWDSWFRGTPATSSHKTLIVTWSSGTDQTGTLLWRQPSCNAQTHSSLASAWVCNSGNTLIILWFDWLKIYCLFSKRALGGFLAIAKTIW